MLVAGYNILETWIFNNHWDTDVSKTVLDLLRQVNSHKTTVLSAFIAYSCLAIFNAMLLILGVCLQGKGTRRYLLLPWIVFDFVTISGQYWSPRSALDFRNYMNISRSILVPNLSEIEPSPLDFWPNMPWNLYRLVSNCALEFLQKW